MAWWIFMISAAPPSSRSSTTAISHSGRARSKPCMAMGCGHVEHASAGRRSPPAPHEAEVVVEVEVGVDLPARRGDRERVAPHPLAHAGDEPGAPVEQVAEPVVVGRPVEEATAVIVDRSIGSFSIVHMSASESLIRCSNRSSPMRRPRPAIAERPSRVAQPRAG